MRTRSITEDIPLNLPAGKLRSGARTLAQDIPFDLSAIQPLRLMMSDTVLRNSAADGAATDLEGTWFAIQDGATSADQVSNERLQPLYNAPASGSAVLTATLSFTGPASTPVTHLAVYDAATLGNLRFVRPLAGDLQFNAAGDLDLTEAPVNVT